MNFTCEAIGEPRPSYDWFLDGVLIESTDEPQLERPGLPQDRGKYTCVASNALGRSEPSSPALLTISGRSSSTITLRYVTIPTDSLILLYMSV